MSMHSLDIYPFSLHFCMCLCVFVCLTQAWKMEQDRLKEEGMDKKAKDRAQKAKKQKEEGTQQKTTAEKSKAGTKSKMEKDQKEDAESAKEITTATTAAAAPSVDKMKELLKPEVRAQSLFLFVLNTASRQLAFDWLCVCINTGLCVLEMHRGLQVTP